MCHTLSNAFLKLMETCVEVLLVLEVPLTKYPEVEDLLCRAASRAEACLFLSNDLLCFWFQTIWNDLQHDFSWVANKTDGAVILA